MTVNRLFVANRGEIALRILRTARRLGVETVLGVSPPTATRCPHNSPTAPWFWARPRPPKAIST
nr:biotin carboxylase N-terminal domain-containing protein [Pararhodobacter sp.]